jgi:hypothetical protein
MPSQVLAQQSAGAQAAETEARMSGTAAKVDAAEVLLCHTPYLYVLSKVD